MNVFISNVKTQISLPAGRQENQNANVKTNVKYRAYYFSLEVIKAVAGFPNEKLFWIISDQLLRSATSVGANLVEAKSSSSRKDFIKYYEISLKSANETKYWLCLLRDGTKADKGKINGLLKEIEEISRMLGSSLLTLKHKN